MNRTMDNPNVGTVDVYECLSSCDLTSTAIDAKLNSMTDDEWFVITDELINFIGFKSFTSNPTHNCSNLFSCVWRKFIEDKDYRISNVKVKKQGRGGAQSKNILEMTKSAFTILIQKTCELRNNERKEKVHFVYVLHNPMFL